METKTFAEMISLRYYEEWRTPPRISVLWLFIKDMDLDCKIHGGFCHRYVNGRFIRIVDSRSKMTRHKPKVTKKVVIEFFEKNRESKSTEIARELNTSASYVRAVLGRAGLSLARSWHGRPARSGLKKKVDNSSRNR